MASEHLGAEQYVEGRLVAVILLVLTGVGALAATTFCGGRACALAAPVVACAAVVALVLLAALNRGAKRHKREGRSYLLAFAVALVWAGGVSALVLDQTGPAQAHLALFAGLLCGLLGGIAAAIVAHLWHEWPANASARPTRREANAKRALAQVKDRL